MIRNEFYNQLINSEPLGFIDPLTDLGEFDSVQMKFKEPVAKLVNKYSGQPYNLKWQNKIEQMRTLYIQYQKSLMLENQDYDIRNRVRNKESKEHVHNIVTTYLRLGFKFKEIEKRLPLSYKQLIRGRKRSDYVMTRDPEFYIKQDLQEGYCFPNSTLPRSMKVN
ncbi:hypothetical protein [Streptococcus agalactiae]|uniref:Modification methylase Sau96I n=1 Tax=Streptococcus agalactiae MRI Z1-216 TaxID=1154879 RepID=A0AAD3A5X0_STRAG|nr:hypothetical protein [Streptococcus agalactiae]EPU31269.1 modification methylase Sau96I [Streptococcus agalactiae MRI Z1-213]EPU36754.1 modification methylase Sau96I [Streptococcus agalactiae MRI Z1-214]EPU39650.1 modification methylase Sau96I [Streptococcus agalactiae MRI Z1-216]EPX05932.1 modification methylase Sau96I [Streptococcus agalactiae MRI Z1-217]